MNTNIGYWTVFTRENLKNYSVTLKMLCVFTKGKQTQQITVIIEN